MVTSATAAAAAANATVATAPVAISTATAKEHLQSLTAQELLQKIKEGPVPRGFMSKPKRKQDMIDCTLKQPHKEEADQQRQAQPPQMMRSVAEPTTANDVEANNNDGKHVLKSNPRRAANAAKRSSTTRKTRNGDPPSLKRRKQSRSDGPEAEAGLPCPITIDFGSQADLVIECKSKSEQVLIKCNNHGMFNLSALAKRLQSLQNEHTMSIKFNLELLKSGRRRINRGRFVCRLRFLFHAVSRESPSTFSTTVAADGVRATDAVIKLKRNLLNILLRCCFRIFSVEIEGATDVPGHIIAFL